MDAKLKKIKTWAALCKAQKKDPKKFPKFSGLPKKDREYYQSLHKIQEAVEYFKQGKPTNYTDGSYKWYPWPYVKADAKRPGGFGFSDTYCDCVFSDACVGSRLCSHDRETAEHIFKMLKKDYEVILLK